MEEVKRFGVSTFDGPKSRLCFWFVYLLLLFLELLVGESRPVSRPSPSDHEPPGDPNVLTLESGSNIP